MAYWSVAISQRPNPLVAPFPAELMKNGWEAIEAGRAAGAKNEAVDLSDKTYAKLFKAASILREGLDRGADCLLQGLRQDRFAHPHIGLRGSDGAADHKLSGRQ